MIRVSSAVFFSSFILTLTSKDDVLTLHDDYASATIFGCSRWIPVGVKHDINWNICHLRVRFSSSSGRALRFFVQVRKRYIATSGHSK